MGCQANGRTICAGEKHIMSDTKNSAGIYAVVQALHQAASNAYPGALDKKGEPREDLPIGKTNSGFKISIGANRLIVKYQEELTLAMVQNKNFEYEVEQKMADIVSYLKREYKAITGKPVSLKKDGKIDILVQSMNRFRSWVNAKQSFIIGNVDDSTCEPEKKLNEAIKAFFSAGRKKL